MIQEIEEKYLSSSKDETLQDVLCTNTEINKNNGFDDFLNLFKSSKENITKTDFIWKKIIKIMFCFHDQNINSFFQHPSNKQITLNINSKEQKKLEKMKEKIGQENINFLNILKIKNKQIQNLFKKNFLNGIPDTLRGVIWQSIIDPLCSDFEILKTEIIELILNIEEDSSYDFNGNDNNNHIDFSEEEEYLYNDSISSYSNQCSQKYDTNSNDSQSPLKLNINRSNDNLNYNIIHYLSSHANDKVVSDIENDLNRTLNQFKEIKNHSIINSLKNILSAYSVIDNEIGYTQGMAFLPGLFLCYMDEYSAFSSFCILMLSQRFRFREFFVHDFPGVAKMNEIWKLALQKYFPKINQKLIDNNVDPIIYTVGWWLTAFSCFSFKKEILLLILDRFLLFGYSSLISFGLVIINVCNKYFKHSKIDNIVSFLQNPSSHPKMNDAFYIQQQWDKNFFISKRKYKRLIQKSAVHSFP